MRILLTGGSGFIGRRLKIKRPDWIYVSSGDYNLLDPILSDRIHRVKFRHLSKNDKKHIKYRVLINGDDFMVEEGKDPNTKAGLRSSELCLEKISSLKSP